MKKGRVGRREREGLANLNRKQLRVLFLLKRGLLGSTGASMFWLNYSDSAGENRCCPRKSRLLACHSYLGKSFDFKV